MRISDWSSDVCSSDLVTRNHKNVRSPLLYAGRRRSVIRQQQALVSEAGVVGEGLGGEIRAGEITEEMVLQYRIERWSIGACRAGVPTQTGRASGRERVGQNEEISGGDVWEEKKKKAK